MTHKSECQSGDWQDANLKTDTTILSPIEDSCNTEKRLSTIRAELARRAFAVHTLADDGYVVCRWNMSCHCQDLAALVAFARRVGVHI